MTCLECGKESKYKCPICKEPYCSVACCKSHKLKQCQAPQPQLQDKSIDQPGPTFDFPTEDTVPPEKLKLLDNSAEIKKCLENPHVREIIEILDNAPHPDELMQEYMREPIFTELVDACLKVVQPSG